MTTTRGGNQDDPDDLAAVLADEAESLQRLIDDAKRLQRQIYDHLNRLRHARVPDKQQTTREPN